MIIYHVASLDALDSTLKNGLKRTSRGGKGSDPSIIKTDTFLDTMRTEKIQKQGLSRCNNIYGYLPKGDKIIDIKDGKHIHVRELINNSQAVLRLNVNPSGCYISDLDIYDTVKYTLQKHSSDTKLSKMANEYWENIIKLSELKSYIPRRPEIMITYDILPSAIEIVC